MRYLRVRNHRGKGRQYHLHTDKDCHRLQKGRGYKTVSRENHPDSPMCPTCAGTEGDKSEQDHSFYNALVEAANE